MTISEVADQITWLGHDGFRIEAGQTIVIDPYQAPAGPKADVLLVTHKHHDHCSPADIERLSRPDTVIVTEKDSAKQLKGDVRVLSPGQSLALSGIRIEAVPAYNTDKNFHPREKGWLGFIIDTGEVRIYHAGDTDFIPEMRSLEVDIALLPVSGTYVMTADEAVEAARAIGPKLAIPMHYGAIVGDASDAQRFKEALAGEIEVRILSV